MQAAFVLMLACSTVLGPSKAKLIEWGPGSPNSANFRQNIDKLEAAPFDGTVISVDGKDGDKRIDLCWEFWGRRAFTREQFANVVEDLRATQPKKYTECFIRINSMPGDINFFDDEAWSAILNNAKLAAWMAKEGNLRGLMFDVEAYTVPTFGYPYQNKMKPASFEDYQQISRRRGVEFIRALNSEYPGITILMTFAHSLLIRELVPWRDAGYVLLASFTDGMMEAQDEKTVIVDALELAYASKTRQDIERLRALVKEVGRGFSLVPEIYDKRMKVGFGIWMDYDSGGRGWYPHEPEKNYFQPEVLQEVLHAALELTDGYVWLYTERLDWYTRRAVTEPYLMAVANAQMPPKKVPESKPSN